jgi:hypothetical protein
MPARRRRYENLLLLGYDGLRGTGFSLWGFHQT